MGKRISTLFVVMALVAAACSSSSSGNSLSTADQELADAIAQSMIDSADPENPLVAEDAACFGTDIVDEMGSDRLGELGLDVDSVKAGASPTDVDLSDDDVDAMVGAMTKCIDFTDLFVSEFEAMGISDEAVSCVVDGMDSEFVESMARSVFADPDAAAADESSQAVFDLVLECFTPDDLQKLSS